MIDEYFKRLSPSIQARVLEIEDRLGFPIEVKVDTALAGRRVDEPGPLACSVLRNSASIIIPSADCFPDESVLHELLHIERFLVHDAPLLMACEDHWTPELVKGLTNLDNMLEHLLIVPKEICIYPCRSKYWEGVILRQILTLGEAQITLREKIVLGGCSLAFVLHVLSDKKALEDEVRYELTRLTLSEQAETLARLIIDALSSKEEMTSICIDHLGLDRSWVWLHYLMQDRVQSL